MPLPLRFSQQGSAVAPLQGTCIRRCKSGGAHASRCFKCSHAAAVPMQLSGCRWRQECYTAALPTSCSSSIYIIQLFCCCWCVRRDRSGRLTPDEVTQALQQAGVQQPRSCLMSYCCRLLVPNLHLVVAFAAPGAMHTAAVWSAQPELSGDAVVEGSHGSPTLYSASQL
jgi:hypothetical protein